MVTVSCDTEPELSLPLFFFVQPYIVYQTFYGENRHLNIYFRSRTIKQITIVL